RQEIPAPYPWEGNPRYFLRAVDQGIGRALWFMNGGRPEPVVAAVGRFAPHRQADLWSGIGLVATFAGGGSPEELTWLREAAGPYRPELALGAVNAVVGRVHAGHVPDRTEPALRALTGLDVAAAVNLVASNEVPGERDGEVPAYELWRQRVTAAFRPGAGTDPAAASGPPGPAPDHQPPPPGAGHPARTRPPAGPRRPRIQGEAAARRAVDNGQVADVPAKGRCLNADRSRLVAPTAAHPVTGGGRI